MLIRLRHFLTHHWHGRVALLPTLLITLLGLRLVLSWSSRLKPPDWPLAVFVLLTALSMLLLVWQVVGSLRAIRRSEGGGLALTTGGAALVVAVILFLSAELDGYASRAADAAGLPPVMPLPVRDGTLELTGPLDWPLYARFCTTLHRHPDLDRVALTSDGGLVPVARAMAARITETGLDTRATGLCASACTLVFMAGTTRSLGPEGELGFHGYALRRTDPLQTTAEEEARDRAWLVARGVDPGFVTRAFATGPDRLWRPDTATLREAGVLRDALPDRDPGSDGPECGPIPDQAASP
ncbi:COG3904 family protein [Marimonas arenosa]|uniref:Clp protease n=1 Tax=Marimonas arenosa TaxID=1795305 RepID=A0AAE4B302_9RHOB|nr:hypothetical protein [Marimonas arenosa]MDQ2088775.1 hypothetical protein [Marimonas arenosa]